MFLFLRTRYGIPSFNKAIIAIWHKFGAGLEILSQILLDLLKQLRFLRVRLGGF